MNPEQHKLLVDQLDQSLRSPSGQPVVDATDAQVQQEKKLLDLALEAINFSALYREVEKVRLQLKASAPGVQEEKLQAIPLYQKNQNFQNKFVHRLISNSMKVAAVLVLAMCIGGLGKFLLTTPSGVYDRLYAPYTIGATRGAGNAESALDEAYQAKNWNGVAAAFAATEVKSGKDYFLMGMSFVEQGQYTQAINSFNFLIENNAQVREPRFQDEAEYYLAMSYLANHQSSKAIPILEKIKSDPNHLFNKKVKELSDLEMLILRAK